MKLPKLVIQIVNEAGDCHVAGPIESKGKPPKKPPIEIAHELPPLIQKRMNGDA